MLKYDMRNKMISIENEQFEWLQEQNNASEIIIGLLQEHINAQKPKTEEEIMKRIAYLEKKEEMEKELKKYE